MEEALLLSIEQSARQLGLGRTQLYELVAAGDIEVVKVGRRTLVPQASLRSFVEMLRQQGVSAPTGG
ncbi:helix-turn-helix domain-containing protein [Kineococcus sp. NPDC059986]|jgi:excisionase family DNA binding protein|uniref:helix-turn-helix domain-containing protein n=1 Tax=Kineococcus sp. NPDC059986 TaxID=3155538 RepID=UPI00344DC507